MLANTNRCNWRSGQAGPPILVQTNAPASDTQHKTGTVAQLVRDAIKIWHIPGSSPSDLGHLRSRTEAMSIITEATEQATLQISMTYTSAPAQHRSISVRQVHAQQVAAAATHSSHATPGISTAFIARPGQLRPVTENSNKPATDDNRTPCTYLVSGTATTSVTTYCSRGNHWLAMCSEDAMNPFLQVPPTSSTRIPMRIQVPVPITAILHYIAATANSEPWPLSTT